MKKTMVIAAAVLFLAACGSNETTTPTTAPTNDTAKVCNDTAKVCKDTTKTTPAQK